ncbi:MAG: helix-turn-helix transcriptional regulator [Bacilli bacterium]|nr:helix-turn-helix transcriptional regulator [Bacilli bacterium]
MKLNKVFGNNVKYFRYRKKYSQEKVAELTDMSVTYISQLELGHHTPSFEKLEALANALGVEPFEFYVKRDINKLPARVDMTDN